MRSRRHMVGSRHVLLMVLAPVLALVAGVVALPGGTNATIACVDTPLFVANATLVRTLVGNVSTRSGASASSTVPPDTLGCVPRILCGRVYACVSCAACSWGVADGLTHAPAQSGSKPRWFSPSLCFILAHGHVAGKPGMFPVGACVGMLECAQNIAWDRWGQCTHCC
jgi:hypothetical protein